MNFSRRFILVFFPSLILVFSLVGGVLGSSEVWSQLIEGDFNDQVDVLIQTSDGGYIIAGNTALTGDMIADFWVMKTDSSGNKVWNQTYDWGDYHLWLGDLVETSDGGFAMAVTVINEGRQTFVIFKADEFGDVLWEEVIGRGDLDKAQAIIETSDGGFVIAGEATGLGGSLDFSLIKTDSTGNFVWANYYGTVGSEGASCLVEVSDGFVLGGSSYSSTYDPWLIKVDLQGNMVWNRTFANQYQQLTYSLVQTPDLGFALAGVNATTEAFDFDYWLIKTDVEGNFDWLNSYEGTVSWYVDSVGLVVTPDGGLAVAGSRGSWSERVEAFVLKTDNSGNKLWNQTYVILDDHMDCEGLIVTSDGGFALAGTTDYYQIFLIKTDEYGMIPEFDLNILVSGLGSPYPSAGVSSYVEGSPVEVIAYPAEDWVFDHWLLDSINIGSTNPIMVTMDSDHELVAVFTEIPPEDFVYNSDTEVFFGDTTYLVKIATNSDIYDVVFNPAPLNNLRIDMDIGLGSIGLCNITIPSDLMWGEFQVYIDDALLVEGIDYNQTNYNEYYVISMNYEHDHQTITINGTHAIPEFSQYLLLPLVVVATFFVLVIKKCLKEKREEC